jgi:hypothetical protein
MFNAASKTNQFSPIKSVNTVRSIMLLVSKVKHKVLPKIINFYRPDSILFEVVPGVERQRLMTFFKAECVIVMIEDKDDEHAVSLEINQIIHEQPDANVFLLSNLEESLYWAKQQIRPEWRNRIQFFNTSKGTEDLLEFTFQLP